MMLTGDQIQKEVDKGNIYIENFVREKVNPNSYNLTLNNKLEVYELNEYIDKLPDIEATSRQGLSMYKPLGYLDSKKPNDTREIIIPEDGYILQPGILYLGSTNEKTFTDKFVPMLDGRSSIGRLGMAIHVTAGFGDVGFSGRWTLEIVVTHPLKIYPNMEVCQISYHPVQGDTKYKYNGKYQNQDGIMSSHLHEEYK